MLCLSGQALAVAERLEETKAAQQKYTELEAHLKLKFKSDADKEVKQQQFDKRHAELNETDDEFMLELVKLYRAANPTADDAQLTCNVKRKFLSGIPAELKRNIFIFCNDPHSATVTIDNILEATRKARLYVMGEPDTASSVNAVSSSNDVPKPDLFEAISRLTDTLNDHMKFTNEQLKTQEEQINAISQQGDSQNNDGNFRRQNNNYNGNRRQNNRRGNNRGRNNYNSNRGRNNGNNDGSRRDFTCYNC